MAKLLDPEARKLRQRRRLMLPLSSYVQIAPGKAKFSRTLIKNHVFAYFSASGQLLGVEVI